MASPCAISGPSTSAAANRPPTEPVISLPNLVEIAVPAEPILEAGSARSAVLNQRCLAVVPRLDQRIALGAPRGLALESVVRHALRAGMMPIINAMAASGVVALSGMMTGQILSGVDPVDATKYQLLIMFLIAGSTTLGTLLSVLGAARLLTDDRHRLRLDRLVESQRPSA